MIKYVQTFPMNKGTVPAHLRDCVRCGTGEMLPKSMSSLSSESLSFFFAPFLIGLNDNVDCFNPIYSGKNVYCLNVCYKICNMQASQSSTEY